MMRVSETGHEAAAAVVRGSVPAAGGLTRGLGATIAQMVATVQEWRERRRQRFDLMALDDHLLKDLGISRADAEREWAKPGWRR
jgi:uncharacterized protein YjiS (DUF1127 family)